LRLAGDLGEQVGSALRGAIGSLNAGEAVRAILRSRLGNPWLFLLLALVLGLAGLGIVFARRRATLTSNDAYAQSNRADQFSPPPLPQSLAIPPSDLFAFVMIFVAAALTFSVEFFYLRDIFSVRMNTVFKFYYQAWVLMGCASAYALWWISKPGGKALGRLGSSLSLAGALALVLAGLVTPAFAIPNRVDGFKDAPNLDGASAIARDNPDDWAAIQWLRENAAPDRGGTSGQAYGNNLAVPVILEAPGGNYNYEGRISAFTGLPAVLGWASHEQQWRGTYDEQARRIADIQTIYAASDRKVTAELLARYHVRYVVLGQTEHDYIVSLCQDPTRACSPDRTINKFRATLHTVFSQGGTTIFEVP
jgi:uncharacterized membrane protein